MRPGSRRQVAKFAAEQLHRHDTAVSRNWNLRPKPQQRTPARAAERAAGMREGRAVLARPLVPAEEHPGFRDALRARYGGMMQDGPQENDAYFGPPDGNEYCAYAYPVPAGTGPAGGPSKSQARRAALSLQCPNPVDFCVKVPDGRESWRKAWRACTEHLPDVIWQMQEAYGGESQYQGAFELLARTWDD